jgi:hypothetical protein
MFLPQPVESHAKAAGGEQIFAITIVVEGARLAHQLVDDVPIVDLVLVTPHQPRQRVYLGSGVPDLHTLGIEPGLEFLTDQPAMHRIGIAVNVDQTAGVHAHRQPQATVLSPSRQRS